MTIPSPRLARPPRDTRLDLVRGWLQITILMSHVGGFASVWLIHAAWGFSDSSEQFVLLSGLMLGSVFTLKQRRDGGAAALADMLRRAARLWRTRLLAMLGFAVLVAAADTLWHRADAAAYHYTFLYAHPLRAIPQAAALLYNTAYFDALAVFIWGMLLLPAFLALAARIGAWALAPPAALWLAVQVWHLPAPDLAAGSPVAFNPLAWQALFLLGAYLGRRKLLTGAALPAWPWLTLAAGLVVAAGLALRLNDDGLIHLGLPPVLVDGADKLDLSPLRLLHALALALLVARLTPRDAPWMHAAPFNVLAAIGRHSLHVFCAGVFVAYVAHALLTRAGPWAEAPLLLAGIALLAIYATARDGAWHLRTTARV